MPSICTLCGHYRDSRLCHCFQRARCTDPYHPVFADVLAEISENRFFGKAAYEAALASIDSTRHAYYAKRIDAEAHTTAFAIGEPQRIDRDAERLKSFAAGKLYNTAQKMAENPPTRPNDALDGATNLEKLKRILGS
jgi:hypothetical protein